MDATNNLKFPPIARTRCSQVRVCPTPSVSWGSGTSRSYDDGVPLPPTQLKPDTSWVHRSGLPSHLVLIDDMGKTRRFPLHRGRTVNYDELRYDFDGPHIVRPARRALRLSRSGRSGLVNIQRLCRRCIGVFTSPTLKHL